MDKAERCPTCGSRNPGSIYAACSVGGSSEMANPSHSRFPNADSWHGVVKPDGTLTQSRKQADRG